MKIRLIQIGNSASMAKTIHEAKVYLNSCQTEYQFYFNDDQIDFVSEEIETDKLEKLVREFLQKEKPNTPGETLTIAFTYSKFEDDLYCIMTHDLELISLHYWNRLQYKEYIVATIIDMLLDYHLTKPIAPHDPPIGCLSDYCAFGNMKTVVEKMEYCNDCQTRIRNAIRNGEVTSKKINALYTVADRIVGRKYAFVLMPFSKAFDDTYESLKGFFSSNGYICTRSDDITISQDIMQNVIDMIYRASIIVADITDNNPNVFYELGISWAFGKERIHITQNDYSQLPFDISSHVCIKYEPTKIGYYEMERTLERYIR